MSSVLRPMRAVVLAAGQGKRMKSHRAKVLHEVLGKPIISRILDALDSLNLEKIHLVVGHSADQVVEYLEKNPPKTSYSTHLQEPQLGTGHALQQVVPELGAFDGTLLVTVGDAPLLSADTLAQFTSKHQEDNAVLSLLTTLVDNPKNYGRIVRDVLGKISKIVEDKDATEEQRRIREINPAIYCFEWPKIAEGLGALQNNNRQNEYYLTDLIGWANTHDFLISSMVADDWREGEAVNSRQELALCTSYMRERVNKQLMIDGVTLVDPSNTWIAPEVKIGPDTIVLPGCYLTGVIEIGSDCVIGPNTVMNGPVRIGDRTSVAQSLVVNSEVASDCRVGPFAHIREHSAVGDHCRIGNFVELKKTDISNSTNVSHLSYVGDASLGSKVNIGAGTITANYDHMTRKKSRTIISDGASTGSNSVLVAPITLGKDAVVAAGTVVTKDVPDGALAVGRARQEVKEGWVDRKKRTKEGVKST